MPVYQAQLNRTDLRSLAPAAGVYNCAPPPRPPRPPPCACPPPAAGAAPRAWALAGDGALIVRTTPSATLVQMILRRKFMMIPRCCLIVRIARRDGNHAPVRHGHRLEETQRAPVLRRKELHRDH